MARRTDTSDIENTVKCCYDVCNLSAKVKVKTATGWANVCMRHYYEHHEDSARKHCAGIGLRTAAEHLAWLKTHAKGLTNRYTRHIPATREPGEDWGE